MKKYYEPIYKLNVTAFIEKDSDKAKKIAEKIIGDNLDEINFNSQAKTIEYVNEHGAQMIICWFKKKDLSLLVHELVHVFEYCFDSRRINFDIKNSEIMAYYLEHLFRVFEPMFRKKK